MSIKKDRLYEKRLTEDALHNLNFVERIKLEKEEDTISANIIIGLTLAFITFMALVAMIIWFNKFTLFITIVLAAPLIIDWWLIFKAAKKYQKTLNKLNGIGISND